MGTIGFHADGQLESVENDDRKSRTTIICPMFRKPEFAEDVVCFPMFSHVFPWVNLPPLGNPPTEDGQDPGFPVFCSEI